MSKDMKTYFILAQRGILQKIVAKASGLSEAKMLKIAITEELQNYNVFMVAVESSISDLFENQWGWMKR